MQAAQKHIHADKGKSRDKQADNRPPGKHLAAPAGHKPQVQPHRIIEPHNKRPGFFRIPAPIAPPGIGRPQRTQNGGDGEKQKAHRNGLIHYLFNHLRRRQPRFSAFGFAAQSQQLGNAQHRRHAECTDCHNPHRVMRNSLFNDTGNALNPTHDHSAGHSNIASGALRGSWGVEPVYGAIEFPSLPLSYQVKTGDGGSGASTAVSSDWVTREYQICLKCHSDYGYSDNNAFPTGTRPNLSLAGGGTPPNTNGLTQYTNQAMEFQAPVTHTGDPSGVTNSGAGSNFTGGTNRNYRSWHPVMQSTGRTPGVRNANGNVWVAPWENNVGTQTMYCSDCHGSDTGNATVVPAGNNPWGPHGSTQNFILKGDWTPNLITTSSLCFRCHSTQYRDGGLVKSGFANNDRGELHDYHNKKMGPLQCNWCHVAVPHGWKNKAFLVNLNDVGPEAGLAIGTEVCTGSGGWGTTDCNGSGGINKGYTNGIYYREAYNKIITFKNSGNWNEIDCGSDSGQTGRDWMRDAACDNPR